MPVLDERTATSTNYADSHLSWQTAFWCLTAVAMNTMSQPTGRILGFRADFNFYIRASPIVCLNNLLSTVSCFLYEATSKHSFSDACLLWESRRFGSGHNRDHVGLESMRKGTSIRLVLFILSALLPAIKLYSCINIPITAMSCTIYLISFVVDETLSGFARLASRSGRHFEPWEVVPAKHFEDFAGTAMAVDAAVVVYLVFRTLTVDLPGSNVLWPILILLAPISQIHFAAVSASDSDPLFRGRGGYLTGATLACSLAVIIAILDSRTAYKEHSVNANYEPIKFAMFLSGLLLFLSFSFLAYVGVYEFAEEFVARQGGFFVRLQATRWLVIGVLIYVRLYNAEDTYDPPWLRVFG